MRLFIHDLDAWVLWRKKVKLDAQMSNELDTGGLQSTPKKLKKFLVRSKAIGAGLMSAAWNQTGFWMVPTSDVFRFSWSRPDTQLLEHEIYRDGDRESGGHWSAVVFGGAFNFLEYWPLAWTDDAK